MSDKEEFEKYILYGIEKGIHLRECIENEILLLIFLAFFLIIDIVLERRDYVLWILFLLPALFYFISVLKLKKGKRIGGANYILHNGILSGCLSFLFGLIGFMMLFSVFEGKERIIMSCIAGTGYILAGILIGYFINRAIRKKQYSRKKGGRIAISSTSGALFGISFAKTFLKDMDNETATGIVCILLFFLSYLTLIGIGSIFKYQYIVSHPEILDAVNPAIKGRKVDKKTTRKRK